MVSTSLEPLELLQDELSYEEIPVRVNAINRLPTVCAAMGIEGTKTHILPYLDTLLDNEEDEIQYAIAVETKHLAKLVGADLIGLIEKLCSKEETIVRDQGVISGKALLDVLSEEEVNNLLVPMALKLAENTFFGARVSACGLIPIIYTKAHKLRPKLRHKFIELCNEDTPMVRRAGAARLGDFAQNIEKDLIVSEVIPILKQLSNDEQDTIRKICMDVLIPIATLLNKEENQRHTLALILIAGEDKSWRVRLQFARDFANLSDAFGKEITDMSLIQTFCLLLRDVETEVRVSATKSLAQCVQKISLEKSQNMLLPILQNLLADSHPPVKSNLCEIFCQMSEQFGKQLTAQKLLPSLLDLGRDTSGEVKMAVLKNLPIMIKIVGPDIINKAMLETLGAMGKDTNWRLRASLADFICYLVNHLGYDRFKIDLQPLLLELLGDHVSEVRSAAIKNIGSIAHSFTYTWVMSDIIPYMEKALTDKSSYVQRVAMMKSVSMVSQVLGNDQINEKIIPILSSGLNDAVPNVRVCALKAIIDLRKASFDQKLFESKLKGKVTSMVDDPDRDVRYFARSVLEMQ